MIDVGTGFMKILYLGRAPRTKETLPDFREKCRVTRHSRAFRGLTGSQRTPGFGASQVLLYTPTVSCTVHSLGTGCYKILPPLEHFVLEMNKLNSKRKEMNIPHPENK